ncbi:MAG TPA: preprotein translocase subunit SecG [Tepidisphaeraceae bacterium]|jgi:preprotein translocase subunit SecG
MTFIYHSLLVLFLVLSLFLVLLVLIQKGRGGGLSAAFGGVGGNTAFGAKTGDVLTWATSIVFGVFLLLAIGLNLIGNRLHEANTSLTVASPTTVPTDAAASVVDNSPIALPPPSPTPAPTPAVVPPTTNPSTGPSTSPTAVMPSASTQPTP